MTEIKLEGPPSWPNYRDLVSEEDWEKYFEGKQYKYDDPLKLALLRRNESPFKGRTRFCKDCNCHMPSDYYDRNNYCVRCKRQL